MKTKSKILNRGEILLLSDGRLVRFLDYPIDDMVNYSRLQFIDRTEESYEEIEKLDIEKILGNSPEVVGNFYMTWGMHKRLNMSGLR